MRPAQPQLLLLGAAVREDDESARMLGHCKVAFEARPGGNDHAL
jgi:hypothetical protein